MVNRVSDWKCLTKAASAVKPGAFERYFELKRLLASSAPKDRKTFEKTFVSHYGLGGAGLTEPFTRRYFQLLYACDPLGQADPYTPLLVELYRFKTRQGHPALQASFVSKLVSLRDESRPIYDRHVSNFFGLRVPPCSHPTAARIAGFVTILDQIQEQYEQWTSDRRFGALQLTLFRKQPRLAECHPTRLCDFLVWTFGDRKLK